MATVRHLGLFPWCTRYLSNNQSFGDGTAYPIGLTLQQMIEFYWRIKLVKITSADGELTTIGAHTFSSSGGLGNFEGMQSNRTEKDLVCYDGSESIIADLGTGRFFYLAIAWSITLYDASSQLYYPRILIQFLSPPPSGSFDDGFASSSWRIIAGGQHVQYIDFLGFGVQLSMGQRVGLPFSTGTISVEEYWPYDPGDGGGPIYNKDTGQQLRPFPN